MSTSKTPLATETRSKLVARRGELARLSLHNDDDGQELRQDHESRERASGEQIAEVLVSLSERERQEVQAIDAAIGRIDLGTWGQCSQCDRKITARRLAAMPEAQTCLDCASASAEAPRS